MNLAAMTVEISRAYDRHAVLVIEHTRTGRKVRQRTLHRTYDAARIHYAEELAALVELRGIVNRIARGQA